VLLLLLLLLLLLQHDSSRLCLLTFGGRAKSTGLSAWHSVKVTGTSAGDGLTEACSRKLLMAALKDTTSSRSTVAVTTWWAQRQWQPQGTSSECVHVATAACLASIVCCSPGHQSSCGGAVRHDDMQAVVLLWYGLCHDAATV
jgi:hypothetical protein